MVVIVLIVFCLLISRQDLPRTPLHSTAKRLRRQDPSEMKKPLSDDGREARMNINWQSLIGSLGRCQIQKTADGGLC